MKLSLILICLAALLSCACGDVDQTAVSVSGDSKTGVPPTVNLQRATSEIAPDCTQATLRWNGKFMFEGEVYTPTLPRRTIQEAIADWYPNFDIVRIERDVKNSDTYFVTMKKRSQ
jgi:hypothetical protein